MAVVPARGERRSRCRRGDHPPERGGGVRPDALGAGEEVRERSRAGGLLGRHPARGPLAGRVEHLRDARGEAEEERPPPPLGRGRGGPADRGHLGGRLEVQRLVQHDDGVEVGREPSEQGGGAVGPRLPHELGVVRAGDRLEQGEPGSDVGAAADRDAANPELVGIAVVREPSDVDAMDGDQRGRLGRERLGLPRVVGGLRLGEQLADLAEQVGMPVPPPECCSFTARPRSGAGGRSVAATGRWSERAEASSSRAPSTATMQLSTSQPGGAST